jgi:hypothetical protein
MSDDQTRPIEPDAPVPPPRPEGEQTAQHDPAQPAYAMPIPAGYPAYGAPSAQQQRPRFVDQVLGMRAVVAVALACLIIGGLSGWILGHAAGSDNGRFGRGPGFMQRGGFPEGQNGFPNGPGFGQAPNGQAPNGQPPSTDRSH